MLLAVSRGTPQEFFGEEEEEAKVIFSVGSEPVVGIPFKVDGVQYATPYVAKVAPKRVTLEAYDKVVGKEGKGVFKGWHDGVTDLARKVDLSEKSNFIMVYEMTNKSVEAKPIVEKEALKEEAKPTEPKAESLQVTTPDYTHI